MKILRKILLTLLPLTLLGGCPTESGYQLLADPTYEQDFTIRSDWQADGTLEDRGPFSYGQTDKTLPG